LLLCYSYVFVQAGVAEGVEGYEEMYGEFSAIFDLASMCYIVTPLSNCLVEKFTEDSIKDYRNKII
jgi:hypothetical protein